MFWITAAARGQDAASTLSALVERADAIVLATTDATLRGSHGQHVVRFTAAQVLRGSALGTFTLSEPAGEACGRALFGLAPGRYVVFLSQRNGLTELAVSGARSLLVASPDAVAHIRALLAAGAAGQRAATLLDGLRNADGRVRHDAALALPRLAGLETMATGDRQRLADAFVQALGSQGPELPPLLVAATRLRLTDIVDPLLRAYLGGRLRGMERLVLRQAPVLGSATVAARLAVQLPGDREGRRLAVQLLAELDDPAARHPLETLLSTARGAVAIQAGALLVERFGATPRWIAEQTSAAMRDAVLAHTRDRRPGHRNILRGGPR